MTEGWIKLHRALLDKAIWASSTAEQKAILITLLLLANHQGKEWEWQGKQFKAQPGQFVTSLDSLEKKCGTGITKQNIRTALTKFEKYEFLTNESTKTGRLITIVNWGLYQEQESTANIPPNKDLTKSQQRPNKELTPNKNDKNDKNDKKEDISKDIFVKKIFDTWNSLGLQKLVSMKGTRDKLLKARVKEYGEEKVLEAIEQIKQSAFLRGQNNSGFTVTFDWFVKPNNFPKVLEGNYKDKNKNNYKDNKIDEALKEFLGGDNSEEE